MPVERDAERSALLTERLEDLVEGGLRQEALALVAELHPADVADVLEHLAQDEARLLLAWLPEEIAGEVLTELEDDFRASLLEEVRTSRLTALLDEMDTDDAADVLADLPSEVVRRVLPRLEDADAVGVLLGYDEETAGGLMATEYVAVRAGSNVAQATEEVRKNVELVDPVYVVYVLDENDRLVGLVSLKRLLLSRASVQISDILEPDVVTVAPSTDQEEVARIMERYDLVVLPVVSPEGVLLGRITIDDIVDVIREEAEEDLNLMMGAGADEDLSTSVLKISRGRLVWLFVGLVGALFSALVIHRFEHVLQEAVVLAMFIPVVMSMAGNAGIQSSAISVQGLASGRLWPGDVLPRLGKELLVAVLNGAALASTFAALVVVLQRSGILAISAQTSHALALTVAIALLTVIVLATCLGAMIPLGLHRLGIDPALAAGPFITTSNDILGLLVYFLVATTIYLR